MRGAILHAPGDVRFEERPDPVIVEPTDAIVRTVAACVCGSDLWPYRGFNKIRQPRPIGHEYVGIIEEVGAEVSTVKPGEFVVGGFLFSDNTCPHCQGGFHSACSNGGGYDGCQAEYIRIPQADGTLLPTPARPPDDLIPSLLSLSDVMATGWFAAVSAGVEPGMTAVVVGDGAVGLCGVIAASQLGAERVIAMSRHEQRRKLALELGATELVSERGDDGIAKIKELTDGVGADAVLECVGTGESMLQALRSTRPGGMVGYVGVPHGVELPVREMFHNLVGLRGGPAPVRRFLPDLMERVWDRRIDPGQVFDVEMPLDRVADAYRAMDQREAIKVLLRP